MSRLKLKLRPYEQLFLNGAVIENGRKQSELTILTPNCNVLRLSQALKIDPASRMSPEEAAFIAAQEAVMGRIPADQARQKTRNVLQPLIANLALPEKSRADLQKALAAADAQNFYFLMRILKPLLPPRPSLDGAA